MKTALTLISLFFISLATLAGEGGTYRVLVVGDSWADLMFQNQTLRTIFATNGHADVLERGEQTVTSGSTAADWTSPANLQPCAIGPPGNSL